MKKNEKNTYSISLDIGTASVGWAVVDENFHILKKGKNNLWGVRLFQGAETAKKTRIYRSTRRRYNKRRERIRLLRELMQDMVLKEDETFFIRMMHTTFLDEEDKANYLQSKYESNYNLFVSSNYNDKDFYNENTGYPTIYHLRNSLMNATTKQDPRLIYLALHHIVKYRGNFLYEHQQFDFSSININDQLNQLLDSFLSLHNVDYSVDNLNIKVIISKLSEKQSRKEKVESCLKELKDMNNLNKPFKEILNGLCGLKFNVNKLFDKDVTEDKNFSLSFSDLQYDDKLNELGNIDEEYYDFIDTMQKIYSKLQLQNILSSTKTSNASISEIMIERYEKHKSDLCILKNILKKYDKSLYDQMFRKPNNIYYMYIHHPSKMDTEAFYEKIKKILNALPEEDMDIQYCKNEIDKENFLLKQNNRDNGIIPYQLQEYEMKKILDNQAKYYPELEKNKEKILSILTFRIPYYYGPLNFGETRFNWLVRKEQKKQERILPWNHEEVVDIDKTAEKFINRMTSYCTYLNEPVMPKFSLTATMYEVLSELNKIRVDGKLIKGELKDKIIKDLFMKSESVSDSTLKNYLKKEDIFLNNQNLNITGYQKDMKFASSLSPWIFFTKLFGHIDESNYNCIEEIIYDMTIFEDRKILKRRLKEVHKLNSDQINNIINKKYKGWSRLSRKLIDGLYADNSFGSHVSILDVMKGSNKVLMEIIHDDSLGYKQLIEEMTFTNKTGKFSYEDVKELHGSPAIKRGIWQSLLIIEEITSYMKNKPKNIFIEFAREQGDKVRTISQVSQLQKAYEDIKQQTKEEKELYKELKTYDKSKKFDSEKIYLYFSQMGKCMYSNERLELSELEKYEIDHIIPRSLFPDDGLDNKVLVLRKENQRKLDNPVISFETRFKMREYWKYLLDHKLITSKKYYNLTRSEYNEEAISKFINRQLVETRQIIKNVTQLINEYYSSTNVVAIRANLVHDFRMKHQIYKNRNVNDFHHAHDAYIAAILGIYIQKRYPDLTKDFIYGKYRKLVSKSKMGEKEKYGFIINSMHYDEIDNETGEIIWKKETIGDIIKHFNYKDYYITKKLETNYKELFKQTILPGDKNSENNETSAKIPVNKYRKDIHKYGGFTGVNSQMYAIEGNKSKKVIRKVVGVPLVYKEYSLKDKTAWIEQEYELQNVRIIKEILYNQLIEKDNKMFYITSPKELVNARQLILDKSYMEVVYQINHALQYKNYKELDKKKINDLYLILVDKMKNLYSISPTHLKRFMEQVELFNQLSLIKKCDIIVEMLKVTQANSGNGKIVDSEFRIGDRIGRKNGQDINLEDIYFYFESVTGIYSKKVKL